MTSENLSKPASRRLRVRALPARGNRYGNPYNFLLAEALEAAGCEVNAFRGIDSIFSRCDVIHLHWPQAEAGGSLPRAFLKVPWMVIRLLLHRWRGACFVWTVHNVKPHEVRNPKVTAALMRFVLRALDGAIFLTAASRDAAVAAMPELSSKPFRVIPHGPYEVLAEASLPIAEARARFALPKAGTVVGFVGDIRPYKGLDILLDAFSQTNPGRATLFIAGSFQASAEYAAAQREKIARLREQGHSVVFWDQRPDDTQLAAAIRACDINVLPYRNITNSGLAIMIIGCGGRILCSDATAFRELRDELGPTWVQVAESQVTGADLLAALEMVSHEPAKDALDAFRAARSWPMIGERTLEFYRDLLSGKANREI